MHERKRLDQCRQTDSLTRIILLGIFADAQFKAIYYSICAFFPRSLVLMLAKILVKSICSLVIEMKFLCLSDHAPQSLPCRENR